MESFEQQRLLLDRLRSMLLKMSESLDRMEAHAETLQSSLRAAQELGQREAELLTQTQELHLIRERSDLERSLARFPLDVPNALSTVSQELKSLLPVWEGASQTAQLRFNRLGPIPERLNQAMRQREAVMERIVASITARQEKQNAAAGMVPEEEGLPQFEVAPPSSEFVVAQSHPAIAVEILLDEPNRLMPPLPSSDMPGLFVATSTPPELGMPIHILVHLPGGRLIEADGFVAWRREGFAPEESGFGVELAAIQEEDRILLLDLLSH